MRLWTLHPKHLDPVGLVALWREALLAQAVLHEKTKGYRHHPQLIRFRECRDPLAAISAYLRDVHSEAARRGYRFNGELILDASRPAAIPETDGQLQFEWEHLGAKLADRNQAWREAQYDSRIATSHPLFEIVPGPIREWERVKA